MKNALEAIKKIFSILFNGYLWAGIVVVALFLAINWMAANYDVLVKTIQYPEAIRQIDIEVIYKFEKHELISPVVETKPTPTITVAPVKK